ncbi:MAG: prepilin-type N-terminal cleavage/methylation domain-containing protein [Proteobacteria bacterium]|nr:prepilin-type N-terminal cleavage/methylation domain-containing protein [Pseudomonadota bacterium]
MEMFRRLKDQKGFTLVELAIVLVIIGIMLGAVLKGQEMINSAKSKRLYSQQREIAAAIYTYYDKYAKYPGDDNGTGIGTRWNPVTYYTAGNGNGLIDGGATGTDAAPGTMFTCAAATASETCGMWDHMRRSNILSGPLDGTNPTNPYGGTVGAANVAVSTLTVNWIGFSRVPSNIAQQIDIQYDDGIATTGSIRALAAYTAGSEAPILLFFKL